MNGHTEYYRYCKISLQCHVISREFSENEVAMKTFSCNVQSMLAYCCFLAYSMAWKCTLWRLAEVKSENNNQQYRYWFRKKSFSLEPEFKWHSAKTFWGKKPLSKWYVCLWIRIRIRNNLLWKMKQTTYIQHHINNLQKQYRISTKATFISQTGTPKR